MDTGNAPIHVATTGKNAESESLVPVRKRGARPVVVMSLSDSGDHPAPLPDLAAGDRLVIASELEVTTDCEKEHSDCVRKPYPFAPEVEVRLIIADSNDAVEDVPGHARILDRQRRLIPHDRHHDAFVFDGIEYVIPPGGLPWQGRTFVNVAVAAEHPDADPESHFLIIGQSSEGKVRGDMSSISVVRERPAGMTRPDPVRTDHRRIDSIPIRKGETRVVYAQDLKPDLKRGEQLAVKAELITSAEHLDFPARATVEVILGEDPGRPEPGSEARRVTASDGRICPRNGRNCLKAESPMTTRKSGVVRIEKNASKALYVLVILETGDPWGQADDDELLVRDGGELRVFRY